MIISDVTPSKYYILNEAPSNPVSGSVWLVESSDTFYKASGTDISAAIVAAKQYINSTWVEKPYCIYQNNRWNCFYGFEYTGRVQTLTVPYTGTYTLEVWGAQGATDSTTYQGGYGAYAKGNITLEKDTKLYVCVGGKGQNINISTQVGSVYGYPNGGLVSVPSKDSYSITYSSGGGSSHILLAEQELKNASSDSILIVGAGGGGSCNWWGYGDNGGSGGGIVGNSTSRNYLSKNSTGGTQTAGGTGGGGGSGYIGNSLLTNKYMYCYNCTTSSDTATKTYTTTNVNETPISNYAKKGNGFVKITFVG